MRSISAILSDNHDDNDATTEYEFVNVDDRVKIHKGDTNNYQSDPDVAVLEFGKARYLKEARKKEYSNNPANIPEEHGYNNMDENAKK